MPSSTKRFLARLHTQLLILVLAVPAAALAQQIDEVRIPMKLGPAIIELFATEFRPDGAGPFPLVLINHGMPRTSSERTQVSGVYRDQSLEFVRRGYVVINPVRRGYGKTGGSLAEGNASCRSPAYFEAGLQAARDIIATIDYARTRSDIDTTRILLVGQSAGGLGALAAASLNIPGLRGVVNFAGGNGSRGPHDVCAENLLIEAFGRYASTSQVPTLWIYAENDLYFGPPLVTRLVEQYRSQGGKVDYRPQPAYGSDGHAFFSASRNIPVWARELDGFLIDAGLAKAPLSALAK